MTPCASDLVYDWGSAGTAVVAIRLEDDFRDALQALRVTRPSLGIRQQQLSLAVAAGVEFAFLGFPAASVAESEMCTALVRYASSEGMTVTPVLMARALDSDLDHVARVQDAAGAAVVADLFIPTSELRATVEGWTLDEMLKQLARLAARATAEGISFRIAFEDSTRTDPDALLRCVDAAVEMGADGIVVNDTVGASTPAGARSHCAFVADRIRQSQTRPYLMWHGHNDRGLALANALAAIDGGATAISGTFLGIGERAGNIPLEQLMLLAADVGGRFDPLRAAEAALFSAAALAVDIPSDQPLVGSDVFSTSTGTHVAAILKARSRGADFEELVYSSIRATQVGGVSRYPVGPNSGVSAVRSALELSGIHASPAVIKAVQAWCTASDQVIDGPDQLRSIAEAAR